MHNQALTGERTFPGLGFEDRPEFFTKLLQLPRSGSRRYRVRVEGRPGWIILDGKVARAILTSDDAVKGRTKESQAMAGGFAAAPGRGFTDRRKTVIAALVHASRDRDALLEQTRTAILRYGAEDSPFQRPEAFAEAMVSHLLGVNPAAGLPRGYVAEEVGRLKASVEYSQPERTASSACRRDLLRDRMGAVESTFLDHLTKAGWTAADMLDEVFALALAGWGSTAAAVTSGISLGLVGSPSLDQICEVLRMCPPSWLLVRRWAGQIDGLSFDGDELLIISPWLIQRNGKGWAAPNEWMPERFSNLGPKTWYMPFGVGSRRCPGEHYAIAHIGVGIELLGSGLGRGPSRLGLLDGRSLALIPMTKG